MNDLTHLSLFTGIGGIDLAAEWAGFQTVGQVEQNPYANRVLRKRFGRKIPRWIDIRDLSAEDFRRRTGIDSPTLISGGFPCQPFSCAGKRRGKEDDRFLWPEMFRIVRELRPTWVLGENVAGIVSMELESCCSDLESEGYTVRAFLIPACGVGAWHRRERVFIVANNESIGCNRRYTTKRWKIQDWVKWGEMGIKSIRQGETLADSYGTRIAPNRKDRRMGRFGEPISDLTPPDSKGLPCSWIAGKETGQNGREIPTPDGSHWWNIEPAVGRVATGIPYRVDRLRCIGNAVVPQQVYPILAGIAQIENSLQE